MIHKIYDTGRQEAVEVLTHRVVVAGEAREQHLAGEDREDERWRTNAQMLITSELLTRTFAEADEKTWKALKQIRDRVGRWYERQVQQMRQPTGREQSPEKNRKRMWGGRHRWRGRHGRSTVVITYTRLIWNAVPLRTGRPEAAGLEIQANA